MAREAADGGCMCVWLVSGDAHEFRRLLHVKHVKQQCDRWVWDTVLRYSKTRHDR